MQLNANVELHAQLPPATAHPVLTWHGYNVFGDRYENNDLIAFAADLRSIDDAGFAVVPLLEVARWVRGEQDDFADFVADGRPVAALSCDDGTDYDWLNVNHPSMACKAASRHHCASFSVTDRQRSR